MLHSRLVEGLWGCGVEGFGSGEWGGVELKG